MPDDITHETFAPLVGRRFRLADEDPAFAIELTEVTALPAPRRRTPTGTDEPVSTPFLRQKPFSLLFRGPLDRLLPQQIYRLLPEGAAEAFDIFIVPIRRADDGYVYQAVFG